MNKITKFIAHEVEDYRILLRNVPSLVVSLFVLSVILMNIMASKELLNVSWLALDCGFLLSWISFLCMDMMTKRFGPKAAIKISLLAVGLNLLTSAILFVISKIGGNWSMFYTYNDPIANEAIDGTIGGTWYVLMGSMIALACASVVNAVLNASIAKMLKTNTFKAFAARSYISTAFGQFVDNLVFALIVSHVFFGWTMTQVIMCSITGAVAELIAEIIFSPVGYKVCRTWEKEDVGQEYLDFAEARKTV